MAKNREEIAEDERDEEDALDEEEDEDEEDESDEDGDSEEDEDEDDDSDEDDSDDEAPLPKTRKELDKLIADRIKAATNRRSAKERTSKNRLSEKNRPGSAASRAESERLDRIEARQQKADELESKRQFGYENDLSPDEVDVVYRLSKKPSAKTLRDPIVKGALEGHRQAKALKKNTPRGSSRPIKVGQAASKDQSPSERRSNFANRRTQILEGQRRGR